LLGRFALERESGGFSCLLAYILGFEEPLGSVCASELALRVMSAGLGRTDASQGARDLLRKSWIYRTVLHSVGAIRGPGALDSDGKKFCRHNKISGPLP
jgi:hypothetical protein